MSKCLNSFEDRLMQNSARKASEHISGNSVEECCEQLSNNESAGGNWSADLLQRRLDFLVRRFGNRLAVTLIELNALGSDMKKGLNEAADTAVFTRLREQLPPESTVLKLSLSVYAIIYAGVESMPALEWLSRKKLELLCEPIKLSADYPTQPPLCLVGRGGLSSMTLNNVDSKNVIRFAGYALGSASWGKVVNYPQERYSTALMARP